MKEQERWNELILEGLYFDDRNGTIITEAKIKSVKKIKGEYIV